MSTQKHPMETYHGMVRTPSDAIKLFEACRLGLLPRVQRRLSEKERQAIRSGSVFVWDEREAGMRRWTDGKSWSASRVSGSFLTYREMEGKRGGGGFNTVRRVSGKTPDSSGRGSDEDQDDGEPDGYRYKADGLMKQSFSITTSNGQHLHLISYYARPGPGEPDLLQPTNDRSLRSVVPVKGMYPESSMTDNTPILPTRNSMPQQHHHSSHYGHHHAPPPPLQTGPHPGYAPYGQHGYSWPPSPVATPPYNHHYTTASAPYPPQHSQQAPPPGHYSRHSPPPPPGYYSGPPPHGAPHTLPPYGSNSHAPAPSASSQYDRLPLPPPQSTRASPPAHAGHSPLLSHSYGPPPMANGRGPSHSPRSTYRQGAPILPPVAGPNSYQNTSPRTRNNLPPVSQSGPLPALKASIAQSSATIPAPAPAQPTAGSSALTPPYQQKPYYPSDSYTSGNSPPSTSAGNKSSLSALLHPNPTPANSEPSSANTSSAKSASSSPRHTGASLVGTAAAATAAAAAAAAAASSTGPAGLLSQQYLQPAPSGEDSRALSRLDKKFCI
ncbi:camp-independent regulatory protein pac2 [Ophiostoma piceae UAMH 11346]|uniref:Camp-independent regulatory protein pac2 n=1 Tax=Ophiostoma piceae (strain UAMH 11346) TaxID=1262450 RepID=S3CWK0_OPHP1|nr:camp-independent regulatory protein pac2 [Ophiostoma piceae UAMH 11346]